MKALPIRIFKLLQLAIITSPLILNCRADLTEEKVTENMATLVPSDYIEEIISLSAKSKDQSPFGVSQGYVSGFISNLSQRYTSKMVQHYTVTRDLSFHAGAIRADKVPEAQLEKEFRKFGFSEITLALKSFKKNELTTFNGTKVFCYMSYEAKKSLTELFMLGDGEIIIKGLISPFGFYYPSGSKKDVPRVFILTKKGIMSDDAAILQIGFVHKNKKGNELKEVYSYYLKNEVRVLHGVRYSWYLVGDDHISIEMTKYVHGKEVESSQLDRMNFDKHVEPPLHKPKSDNVTPPPK